MRRLGTGFQDRFRLPPRPLQQAVDELDPNDPDVRLLIAESETGSGKTEAALNWFCKLFAAGKVESLYFALPTRVAARELYERVRSYISNWFPHEGQRPTVLLAVPGYAQVDGVDPKSVLASPEDANLWQDDDGARRFDRHWAAERPKRFLAATVAVGTIDQALLSIVQTGHAHLRSACLNRSLLVVDEVHASDQYMAELLRALLDHHLNVGGYALLLSATLGSAARQTFLQKSATPHVSFEDAVSAPYPALTLANGSFIPTKSHKQRSKVVSFQTKQYMFQTQQIIEDILPALRAGARVLIVLNTVGRVIDVFRDIWANPDIPREWGYPACAGIDRRRWCSWGNPERLPRMRGDRPQTEWIEEDDGEATPHARGSTWLTSSAKNWNSGYPACAGIDPCQSTSERKQKRLPRMRGDRPCQGGKG